MPTLLIVIEPRQRTTTVVALGVDPGLVGADVEGVGVWLARVGVGDGEGVPFTVPITKAAITAATTPPMIVYAHGFSQKERCEVFTDVPPQVQPGCC